MEKKRVMLVDDEKDFVKIMKLNLEMMGSYEVMALSTAEGIMAEVQEFKPDIILLDILMPKVDGTEVCRMLSEDPAAKSIPVIIISALDTDQDRAMVYKLGAVEFVAKPIEKKDLIEKIEKVLKHK